MLTFEHVDAFGLGAYHAGDERLLGAAGQAQGESLMQYLRRVAQLGGYQCCGLGAAYTDWDAYYGGGKTASYRDAIVACIKDSQNSPICWLNAYPRGTSKALVGPVADLQKAADELLST